MTTSSSACHRPGSVLPLLVLSLTALVGIVAIVIDGGMALAAQRQGQAAVDAAALAGASVLYANYPQNQGLDVGGSAAAAALALASDNGYSNSSGNSVVQVNIPPASGTYAGQAGYVEVILTYTEPSYFCQIFSSSPIQITNRAVACGIWAPSTPGILLLDPSDKGAVSVQGNGAVTDISAPMIVNSNNAAAVTDSGNGVIRVPNLNVTGGVSLGGNGQVVGTVNTGVHPTPDPLAFLPAPGDPNGPPLPGAGSLTQTRDGSGYQYNLYPGQFSSLPTFSSSDQVIFHQASSGNSGIYYLASGGLNAQGASLSMAAGESGGIFLYNAGTTSSDAVSIAGSGNGSINLAAPTSGPYQGLLLFQSRGNAGTLSIAGNGSFKCVGTLYAPAAEISITGNGSSTAAGSQIICRSLYLAGNGSLSVSYNANTVARTRSIGLVE